METLLAVIVGLVFGLISALLSAEFATRNREDSIPAILIGVIVAVVSLFLLLVFGTPSWAIAFGPAVCVFAIIFAIGGVNT